MRGSFLRQNLRKAAPRLKVRLRRAANPAMPAEATKRLALTTSQAARHLGVSMSTVRRWADQGHLPMLRTPGRQRRFSPDQLDAFLASLRPRRVSPTASARSPR